MLLQRRENIIRDSGHEMKQREQTLNEKEEEKCHFCSKEDKRENDTFVDDVHDMDERRANDL